MPQPIQLHFAATPNGRKILIALEEMELPYELVWMNLGAGDQFKPEFLAISPNNRMPAIVDPEGPDGQPISVFESGAILQYLGRKTGKFYPGEERARVNVDQWLFWQVAGLGPMAGQANHFRHYAPTFLKDQRHAAYGAARYTNEVERLYGVLDGQLRGKDYICGDYSIADMAAYPWILPATQGQHISEFPSVLAWYDRMSARPAVHQAKEIRSPTAGLQTAGAEADKARSVLFGQRARR